MQWAALTAGAVLVLSLGPHLHVFGRRPRAPLVAPYAVATSLESMHWLAAARSDARVLRDSPSKGLVFDPAPSATGDALATIQRAAGSARRHKMAYELDGWQGRDRRWTIKIRRSRS